MRFEIRLSRDGAWTAECVLRCENRFENFALRTIRDIVDPMISIIETRDDRRLFGSDDETGCIVDIDEQAHRIIVYPTTPEAYYALKGIFNSDIEPVIKLEYYGEANDTPTAWVVRGKSRHHGIPW